HGVRCEDDYAAAKWSAFVENLPAHGRELSRLRLAASEREKHKHHPGAPGATIHVPSLCCPARLGHCCRSGEPSRTALSSRTRFLLTPSPLVGEGGGGG